MNGLNIEVIKLDGQDLYWVDVNNDNLVQPNEKFHISTMDGQNEKEKVFKGVFITLSLNDPNSCANKLKALFLNPQPNVKPKFTIYDNKENFLNTSYDPLTPSQNIQRLRQRVIQQFNSIISELEIMVKQERLEASHPYALLLSDLKKQVLLLEKIRIRYGAFQDMYDQTPDMWDSWAAYNHLFRSIDINSNQTGSIENALLMIFAHELDHALLEQSGIGWNLPTDYAFANENCQYPARGKEILPTKENTTVLVQLDFGRPEKLIYNSIYFHPEWFPLHLDGKTTCSTTQESDTSWAIEARGYQMQARLQAFLDKVPSNIFTDLKKQGQLRNAAVHYLKTKYPVVGQMDDAKNYNSIVALHYFGIGQLGNKDRADLYDFLTSPENSYLLQPSSSDCTTPQYPNIK